MTPVAIPAWNTLGLLPPIDTEAPASSRRSPYPAPLLDLVQRFSTSQERQAILHGFLEYRQALHDVGLASGFQWLDGSFLEHVELLEQRAPRDIDVVTFYRSPDDIGQQELLQRNPDLFRLERVKERFSVDGYLVNLGMPAERLVAQSSYWYSMWSHRRNQAWKGFLQIDLAPLQDVEALAWLQQQGEFA